MLSTSIKEKGKYNNKHSTTSINYCLTNTEQHVVLYIYVFWVGNGRQLY